MQTHWMVVRAHPWRTLRPRHVRRIPYRARGKVWRDEDGLWRLEVRVGNTVVVTDNAKHWRSIIDQCNEAVWAFNYVAWVGHTFTPYRDL